MRYNHGVIQCRSVRKQFGEFAALDDVSIEVPSGICALIGPNGAGKSTLLKVLTGLLLPDSGEVQVSGFDPVRQSLELRRVIGVVPEDLGLFDSLSVYEHLELTGPIYGLSQAETRERADTLLRVLGLDYARDRYADRCSHGMRKKTALAMALLPHPRVLFLDEPFEGIDPVSAKTIENLLTSIASRRTTVFLTSHVLSIVDRLAGEIYLMRQGKVVWHSATETSPRALEEIYFELVEAPTPEEIEWQPSRQS